MTKEIDEQREFYQAARPENIRDYFNSGSYKVVLSLARKNLVPAVDIVNLPDLSTLENAEKVFASVAVVNNPEYQQIDPQTNDGKKKVMELTTAKGLALKEQTNDPKVKSKIDSIVSKFLEGAANMAAGLKGKKGVKTAAAVGSAFAFGLSACSPNLVVPGVPAVADGGNVARATETAMSPTTTPTTIPTETLMPTSEPTQTPEPRFDIKLETSPNLPSLENLQVLPWEYATSEQFIKDIIKADKEGKVAHPTKEYIPLEPEWVHLGYRVAEQGGSSMYKRYGWANIIEIPAAIPKQNRDIVNARSLVGVWRSTIANSDVVVFVIRWENKDKSAGYLGYFYPKDNTPQAPAKWLSIAASTEDGKYLQLGEYENPEMCGKAKYSILNGKGINDFSSVCQWIANNPMKYIPREIYERWSQTGVLSNNVTDSNNEVRVVLPLAPVTVQRLP